jgi:hypothetical protein
MQGGDLFKRKKKPVEARSPRKGTPIPKESKKRSKDHKTYLEQIKLFWAECLENKTNYCLFCGEWMPTRDNIHHMKGRTGDYYLDKLWWANAHNECHIKYHYSSFDILFKEWWYNAFLTRLLDKSAELYYKELKKQDKSQKLNPELFDEENDE